MPTDANHGEWRGPTGLHLQCSERGVGLPALSFVSVGDLATYVKSFQSAANGSQRIGGHAARGVLMQSKLPVAELGRIWELSDVHKQGSLSLAEFVLAMFLAQSRIRGKDLPDRLPPAIVAEIGAANSRAAMVSPQLAMGPQLGMAPQAPAARQMAMAPPASLAATSTAMGRSQAGAVDNGAGLEKSFESRFPDIGPSAGALRNVRQSFHQSMLGSQTSEQQPQHQWAINAQERAQYEAIFRQWDSARTGAIKGAQAREVFAQSSLPQHELAKIWGLADINNQGELNLDEFSVAMHLIFRKLAGAPIPDKLPADLVPRSSKNFMDSLNDMKDQLMFQDVVAKKPLSRASTPAYDVSPRQHTGDSGFDGDEVGVYRSANRRKNTGKSAMSTGRSSAEPVTPGSEPVSASGQSLDDLRAEARRRRDAVAQLKSDIDKRGKEQAEGRVTRRWKVDDLKREIEDIHRTTPLAVAADDGAGDGDAERARLLEKRNKLLANISELLQTIPHLAADYRRLADDLVEANKDAIRKKKSHGAAAGGSGGTDVESRAARLVAERMAALTGQTMDSFDEVDSSETDRIDRQHRERIERMESVTNGLARVHKAVKELNVGPIAGAAEPKWESGAGLQSDEVKELVRRLQLIPRAAPPARSRPESRPENRPQAHEAAASSLPLSPLPRSQPTTQQTPQQQAPSLAQRLATATNPQDRERILKEIAEERFRERQRALGIPDQNEEPSAEPPAAQSPVHEYKPTPKADPKPVSEPKLKLELGLQSYPPLAALEETPFKSPVTPAGNGARPEMSQRTDDADLLGLSNAGDSAPASNPFAAQVHQQPLQPKSTAAPAYADIFSQSLEVDDYSDSSSENEWDRDDSSDDDGGPSAAKRGSGGNQPSKVVAAIAAVVSDDGLAVAAEKDVASSPESSVSFNTAFAQPAAGASGDGNGADKDETNPFLGLLSLDANKGSGDGGDGVQAESVAPIVEHKVARVRALYPYNNAEDGDAAELPLEPGALIETRAVPTNAPSASTHAGDGWMYGELLQEVDEGDGWGPSGKVGWFPTEYAETLGEPGSRGWDKTKARFGVAKYDYAPQNEDELGISTGDRVRVVDGDVSESWWKVRKIASKEVGMLPAMYIELDK